MPLGSAFQGHQVRFGRGALLGARGRLERDIGGSGAGSGDAFLLGLGGWRRGEGAALQGPLLGGWRGRIGSLGFAAGLGAVAHGLDRDGRDKKTKIGAAFWVS